MFVRFLAGTGCRIGETCAVEWSDVDLDKMSVTISKSYSKGVVSTPKNDKTRKVNISPDLVAELRKLMLRTQSKGETVFQNADGGRIDSNNFRHRNWTPTLKKAGLRHNRIHSLRHSYASLMIMQTKDIFFVSKQLGHASTQITDQVYGHLIDDDYKKEMASVMDSILDEAAEA